MIEIEKTFLAKKLPENLKNLEFKEVIDIYIPASSSHPTTRIRKNGDKYEITKKEPINGTDSSIQKEQTIFLAKDEFDALVGIGGKKLRKLRYLYKKENYLAEIDVFQDDLAGLVVIDVEFSNAKNKDEFVMPDFCLADITQEKFTAGGMLAGKKYSDIEGELAKFNYEKLNLEN